MAVSGARADSKIHIARKLAIHIEREMKMAKFDLSAYGLNELRRLGSDVENEITVRHQQELGKARNQILSIAQGLGLSVEELLGTTRKKAKGGKAGAVEARYRNPADSQQTWTGRGRQPKWVGEALANGRNLDDFRIH
jgi:DNA-binding protein H-NS